MTLKKRNRKDLASVAAGSQLSSALSTSGDRAIALPPPPPDQFALLLVDVRDKLASLEEYNRLQKQLLEELRMLRRNSTVRGRF